jgi:magnesium-transporting ATPase (P-type)
MFNAMNAISDESSLLTIPITRNPYLIVAICSSISIHCMILYVPFFNDVFGIAPLDMQEWLLVLVFSFPVVLLDEMIKFVVRNLISQSKVHSIEHKEKSA